MIDEQKPESLTREAIERGNATAGQIIDLAAPERLNASDQFRSAGAAMLTTPQGQRERDLTEVTKSLEAAVGAAGSLEKAAFDKSQAALGEQIAKEADPGRRVELRNEREAAAHDYAGGLAGRVGTVLEVAGQPENATEVKRLGELHKEIAAELRGGQTPPPDQTAPQRPDNRADISADMANVGREIGLGATARTVHVAEMQQPQGRAGGQDYAALKAPGDEPQPDMEQARANAQHRAHIRPEIVNDLSRQTVTATHSAKPTHRDDDGQTGDTWQIRDQRDKSSQRQEAEADASYGKTSPDRAKDDPFGASITAAMKANREVREAALATDKGEPERPQQGTGHTAAFRSFGR